MSGDSFVSRILPPIEQERLYGSTIRMTKAQWAEIDAVAKETGYSRADVCKHFLRYALAMHQEEQKTKQLQETK